MTGRHPLSSPRVRRWLAIGLAAATVGVAVFVLGPTGELPIRVVEGTSARLESLGLPGWATDTTVWELVYNVLLFVPVAFTCATLWRRVTLLRWTLLGLAASVLIETVQAVLLADRTPQLRDLVANTLGALAGAALARVVWRALHRG